MGISITLLRRLAIPDLRLFVILRHTLADVVHTAEAKLGSGIALLRQWQPLFKGLPEIAGVGGRQPFIKTSMPN